jgi:RNA polymerase sigma-70 factor (ECF subfamily)
LETEFLADYDAHANAIFRHCYFKTSEREAALDMTQDVFLRAWSYLRRQPVRNMRALLYRIADNLAVDWYRRRKTESLDALMEEGFEPTGGKNHIEEQAEAALALAKLRELDDGDRELITLRFVEGFSPREIGEIVEQSENAVSVRLHRAMKRFRAVCQ